MKNLKLFLIPILFMVSSSIVSADTLSISTYSSYFDTDIAFTIDHATDMQDVIDVWEDYFSPEFPYYYIKYNKYVDDSYEIVLTYSNSSDISYVETLNDNWYEPTSIGGFVAYYSKGYDGINSAMCYLHHNSTDDNCFQGVSEFAYYYMNLELGTSDRFQLPLYNHGFIYSSNDSSYNQLLFNGFTSSEYDLTIPSFSVVINNLLPDYHSLYDESYDPDASGTYVEIDLNNYAYVILSLKDYTPIEEQFFTNIYVKGSLCLTPVYDYGMKEKRDYYTGYQVQGCTEYYSEYTPTNVYVLPQDVTNHAVYYIKSSNIHITNSIKVDSSIFNIAYITSENENNPSVTISGRNYPTLPYDDLTDTAIISSENGYISGISCPVGDLNCYAEFADIDVDDLFTNPLNLLRSVWTSITGVLVVIAYFINILPPTLQAFMFTAFILALVLGVLKILL